MVLHRQREPLVVDQRRRRGRARVFSAHQSDQRHVRWPSTRRQSVQRQPGLRQVRHRRACLALPDRPSRSVGLRFAGRSDSRRHHRRRETDQSRGPADQAGVCLRVRSDDRVPVWPIEERRVPASDTPGERTSPTQPFPTKPPPFDRQGVSIDDLIDFTPELRKEALDLVKQYKLGPLFTPPTVRQRRPERRQGDGAAARLGRRCGLAGRRVRSRDGHPVRRNRSPVPSWPISSRATPSKPTSTTWPACARIHPDRRGCRC